MIFICYLRCFTFLGLPFGLCLLPPYLISHQYIFKEAREILDYPSILWISLLKVFLAHLCPLYTSNNIQKTKHVRTKECSIFTSTVGARRRNIFSILFIFKHHVYIVDNVTYQAQALKHKRNKIHPRPHL